MARFLLAVCLIIGLVTMAQGYCPARFTLAQCQNGRNEGGAFKKSLISALLERRNLNLAELSDESLERALNLLLEEERNDDGKQDFVEEEEKEFSPDRELEEAEEKRVSRYEELKELLDKILTE